MKRSQRTEQHASCQLWASGGWGPARLICILIISMGKQGENWHHTVNLPSMKFPPHVYPFYPWIISPMVPLLMFDKSRGDFRREGWNNSRRVQHKMPNSWKTKSAQGQVLQKHCSLRSHMQWLTMSKKKKQENKQPLSCCDIFEVIHSSDPLRVQLSEYKTEQDQPSIV